MSAPTTPVQSSMDNQQYSQQLQQSHTSDRPFLQLNASSRQAQPVLPLSPLDQRRLPHSRSPSRSRSRSPSYGEARYWRFDSYNVPPTVPVYRDRREPPPH